MRVVYEADIRKHREKAVLSWLVQDYVLEIELDLLVNIYVVERDLLRLVAYNLIANGIRGVAYMLSE